MVGGCGPGAIADGMAEDEVGRERSSWSTSVERIDAECGGWGRPPEELLELERSARPPLAMAPCGLDGEPRRASPAEDGAPPGGGEGRKVVPIEGGRWASVKEGSNSSSIAPPPAAASANSTADGGGSGREEGDGWPPLPNELGLTPLGWLGGRGTNEGGPAAVGVSGGRPPPPPCVGVSSEFPRPRPNASEEGPWVGE